MGKESKQKLGRKNLWRALTGCTMAVLLAVFGLLTGLVLPLAADTGTTVDLPKYGWIKYNWGEKYPIYGKDIWQYDGDYYYFNGNIKYKLTTRGYWSDYDWNGGKHPEVVNNIWYYNGNYYYSGPGVQYKLNQTMMKWEDYTGWNKAILGCFIWECNGDYYYSDGSTQYKLNQTTRQWEDYTGWGISFDRTNIWEYNGNYYYSYKQGYTNQQYKLNKTTGQWENYTGWGNIDLLSGCYVWQYKGNYYFSYGGVQYKLNQTTVQWEHYTDWEKPFNGDYVWQCNGKYYYSFGASKQYILHEHSWSNEPVAIAGTCTRDGGQQYTCASCGENYFVVTAPAIGEHDWDDGVETACTCSDDGNMLYTCKICGETRSEVISAAGHDDVEDLEWTITQEATCLAHGRKDKLCTKCGASLAHEETELAEHSWGGYEITQKPTTEQEGEKARHCTVCGTIDEDSRTVVPKLEPKKNGTVWIIVGAAVAVGGLGVMLAFLIKRSRQKVDVEFTKKV